MIEPTKQGFQYLEVEGSLKLLTKLLESPSLSSRVASSVLSVKKPRKVIQIL